jgi:RimJ/RimL family protein N-acetyltransferase
MVAMVYARRVTARSWLPESIPGRAIVLRRHVPGNLAAFRRWYGDPEIARLARYQDAPMTPGDIDRFFQQRLSGTGTFAMAIHLRDGDRLIGSCALSQLDGDNGSALFHITIGEKDCWGRGYGTEATRLMLGHAFGTLGLHRVALAVFAFNERAIRSYRKVGFVEEGRSREAIWRDGAFWDEIQMSVLEREWRATRGGEADVAAGQAPGTVDTPASAGAPRTAAGRAFTR